MSAVIPKYSLRLPAPQRGTGLWAAAWRRRGLPTVRSGSVRESTVDVARCGGRDHEDSRAFVDLPVSGRVQPPAC